MPIHIFGDTLISIWFEAAIYLTFTLVAVEGFALYCTHNYYFQTVLKSSSLVLNRILALGLFLTSQLLVGLMPGGYTAPMQLLVPSLGIFLFLKKFVNYSNYSFEYRKSDFIWLLFPTLYFVTRTFSCGLLQQHSDALYYHLAAPKLWAELGQIRLTAEHPSYAQAGIFEILMGLPMLFRGPEGLHIKMVTQIYSQWLHMIFGQITSVFIAVELLKSLLPSLKIKKSQLIFLAWLATTLPSIEWLGCLAKNDFVLTAFSLAAIYWAMQFSENKYSVFLAGLFAGFAYSAKTLAVIVIAAIPFFIIVKAFQKREPKLVLQSAIHFVLGLAIAITPFFLRNIIWCKGNLLFPYMDHLIGPHWLSDNWSGHLHASGGDLSFNAAMITWLGSQLFAKWSPKILLFAGFVTFFTQKNKKEQYPLLVLLVALLFVMLLLLKPAADGRYGIFVGVFWVLVSISYLTRYMQNKNKKLLYVFLPFALFINIPLDTIPKIAKNYLFQPAEQYLDQFHWTYDSKKWLNQNTPKDTVVLFNMDKVNFYLERSFEPITEMKKWEDLITSSQNMQEVYAKMRAQNYRYLHINLEGVHPGYMGRLWPELMSLKSKAVFTSSTSLIYDLTQLP